MPPSCSTHDLPDAVLGRIFTLAGLEDGAVLFVCKQWLRVALDTPELWAKVVISDAKSPTGVLAKRSFLRGFKARSTHLRCLRLDAQESGLAELVPQLLKSAARGATLKRLSLESPALQKQQWYQCLKAITPMTHLTSLVLHAGDPEDDPAGSALRPRQLAACLQGLTQLRFLDVALPLGERPPPASLFSGLQHLTELGFDPFDSGSSFPLHLGGGKGGPKLRTLRLEQCHPAAEECCLESLGQLESLALGEVLLTRRFQEVLPQLTRLTSLTLRRPMLDEVHGAYYNFEAEFEGAAALIQRTLAGIAGLRALSLEWAPLPEELPEGAAQQLTRLEYYSDSVGAERRPFYVLPSAWCTGLPSLKALTLSGPGDFGLPSEFSRLVNLEELAVLEGLLEHLPDEITALTRLTRLVLDASYARELPPGQYLTGIKQLEFHHDPSFFKMPGFFGMPADPVRALPEVICGATSLERLALPGINCLVREHARTLQQLPRLSQLVMPLAYKADWAGEGDPQAILKHFRAQLPGVEVWGESCRSNVWCF